jgi:hypothetical protein
VKIKKSLLKFVWRFEITRHNAKVAHLWSTNRVGLFFLPILGSAGAVGVFAWGQLIQVLPELLILVPKTKRPQVSYYITGPNCMNKGTYTYCLLQYHHSQYLGEVLNIGLLVYFPHQKKLVFLYPEKLIRLRFTYPNVPGKTIKAYFKYFEQRAEELSANPEIFADYDLSKSLQQFVNIEFLAPDSSALQFGNFRISVLYTPDIEHIKNQLYNLYFSVFGIQDNVNQRVDEAILLNKYKKFLKVYAKGDLAAIENNRFHFDYTINPNATSAITFDVAWKDAGSLHLVKPISFDLVRPETINRKAYQYYGQFTDLQEYAESNNYLFDVILAKPKAKALFSAYDNAIRLLQKPSKVTLVELNELDSYSKATAETALA